MTMTIAEGVAALGLITPTIMTNVTSILELFMAPPLVFFTAAAFVLIGFKIATYLFTKVRNSA